MDHRTNRERAAARIPAARRALAAGFACAAGVVATAALAADKAPPVPVEWVSVAKSDRQEAFVDPASRRDRDGYVEFVTRYEYVEPQPFGKKTFQSARNVYRFDCNGRRLADRENKVYEGHELQGKVVTNSTRSTKNLIWRDAAKGTVDGAVLDYVCRKLVGASAPPAGTTQAPGATGQSAPATTKPTTKPGEMPKSF